jgi:hypothetical protein
MLCHKGTALLHNADEGTACSYKSVCEHIQQQNECGCYVYHPPQFFFILGLNSDRLSKLLYKSHAHNRPKGPKGVPGRLRPRIFLTFGT